MPSLITLWRVLRVLRIWNENFILACTVYGNINVEIIIAIHVLRLLHDFTCNNYRAHRSMHTELIELCLLQSSYHNGIVPEAMHLCTHTL